MIGQRRLHTLGRLCLAGWMVWSLNACGGKQDNQAGKTSAPLTAKAQRAELRTLRSSITSTAEILPFEQVELKAPVSGTVLSISFNEGQYVSAGTPLIQLDDRTLQAERIGVEANLSMLKKERERRVQLREIDGVSAEEVERIESQIAQLEAQVRQLEVQISLCRITAPFSGVLGVRDFSLGAFLTQGMPITTLTQTDRLKAEFRIPEPYVREFSLGQPVPLVAGNDTVQSKIYAMEPVIDPSSRMLRVRSEIISPSSSLRAGAFAKALLNTQSDARNVVVPNESIIPSLDHEAVFLYRGGRVKRQVVVTGMRDYSHCEIISGVEPGDTVLTTGLLILREGAEVNVEIQGQIPTQR